MTADRNAADLELDEATVAAIAALLNNNDA